MFSRLFSGRANFDTDFSFLFAYVCYTHMKLVTFVQIQQIEHTPGLCSKPQASGYFVLRSRRAPITPLLKRGRGEKIRLKTPYGTTCVRSAEFCANSCAPWLMFSQHYNGNLTPTPHKTAKIQQIKHTPLLTSRFQFLGCAQNTDFWMFWYELCAQYHFNIMGCARFAEF